MELELRLGEVRYPMLLGTDRPEFITQRLLALSASRYFVVGDTETAQLFQDIVAMRFYDHIHNASFRAAPSAPSCRRKFSPSGVGPAGWAGRRWLRGVELLAAPPDPRAAPRSASHWIDPP